MDQSSRRLQLPAGLLEPGMFVVELDKPWEGSPFLIQGFELRTAADVEAVKDYCDYVYIDPSRQSQGKLSRKKPPSPIKNFEQAIDQAQETFSATSTLLKNCMDDIRFGKALDPGNAKELISDCVKSIVECPDAMLLLTQLKNKDEYTSQHSMNVCILAITLGRQLGLSIEDLEVLGFCGLFHDIGKMKVPLEILNKADRLTNNEFQLMKAHAKEGRNVLMSARSVAPHAVDVAFSHHERLDGTGYPRGIRAENITDFTKIVTIVDAYDAMTSDRCYQNHKSHLHALNIITKNRNTQFDANLAINFIQAVGIYPPGSLVELNNGHIAVVLAISNRRKSKPRILVIQDDKHNPTPEIILDLEENPSDRHGVPLYIKDVFSQNDLKIDIKKHLDKIRFDTQDNDVKRLSG